MGDLLTHNLPHLAMRGSAILTCGALALLCIMSVLVITDAYPVGDWAEWAEETNMVQTGGKRNVNGGPLKECSTQGMAMTGFTRSGKCEERNDDAGSHHICIDLKSVSGTSNQSENFCRVTGQPNWCDDKGSCFGSSGQCPRKHWCVCQWAFAAYIQKAGGCNKIQNIICEATNMEAYNAYLKQGKTQPHIAKALACLKQRCNL